MYTTISSCRRCGAPIYTYSTWMSIAPPPTYYSCNCFPQAITTTSNTIPIGFVKSHKCNCPKCNDPECLG